VTSLFEKVMISLWDKFDGDIKSETAKSIHVCKAVFQPLAGLSRLSWLVTISLDK
jgi:hypothetical protein